MQYPADCTTRRVRQETPAFPCTPGYYSRLTQATKPNRSRSHDKPDVSQGDSATDAEV